MISRVRTCCQFERRRKQIQIQIQTHFSEVKAAHACVAWLFDVNGYTYRSFCLGARKTPKHSFFETISLLPACTRPHVARSRGNISYNTIVYVVGKERAKKLTPESQILAQKPIVSLNLVVCVCVGDFFARFYSAHTGI